MTAFNPRTELYESCDCAAAGGMVQVDGQLRLCALCGGSTRRLRRTHDPRSAIDSDIALRVVAKETEETAFGLSPFYAALPLTKRLTDLVAAHPNDADLGAAVRALVEGRL